MQTKYMSQTVDRATLGAQTPLACYGPFPTARLICVACLELRRTLLPPALDAGDFGVGGGINTLLAFIGFDCLVLFV
jgi:hypothetical protein